MEKTVETCGKVVRKGVKKWVLSLCSQIEMMTIVKKGRKGLYTVIGKIGFEMSMMLFCTVSFTLTGCHVPVGWG